jgi:hypothetical protein
MAIGILFAIFVAVALLALLAIFGKNPAVATAEHEARDRPDDRERIPPARLRALVTELLGAMGVVPADYPPPSPEAAASQRFSAERKDPFHSLRYIVFLEASPPGDVVEQPTVLELIEQIKFHAGSVGMLVTPYKIERTGVAGVEEEGVHLVDGAELRDLVAEHLPHRKAELDRYRLAGVPARPAPAAASGEGAQGVRPLAGRRGASHART